MKQKFFVNFKVAKRRVLFVIGSKTNKSITIKHKKIICNRSISALENIIDGEKTYINVYPLNADSIVFFVENLSKTKVRFCIYASKEQEKFSKKYRIKTNKILFIADVDKYNFINEWYKELSSFCAKKKYSSNS
ncbi:MAG: hypothetical protein LBO62_07310, partial [Endomicrobium sp.]|nr:hypothetical protein [Endomicrobium sp.]